MRTVIVSRLVAKTQALNLSDYYSREKKKTFVNLQEIDQGIGKSVVFNGSRGLQITTVVKTLKEKRRKKEGLTLTIPLLNSLTVCGL